jgi:hypothetical protein
VHRGSSITIRSEIIRYVIPTGTLSVCFIDGRDVQDLRGGLTPNLQGKKMASKQLFWFLSRFQQQVQCPKEFSIYSMPTLSSINQVGEAVC